MFVAITRSVPASINDCQLTHLGREPIDLGVARSQHAMYERALADLGVIIRQLPPADDLPDSVFVEDAAVVVDEIAVVTRPGAETRRAETQSVAAALGDYRKLAFIEAPGTMDGGDVLTIGKNVYVGLSGRTDEEGARQLRRHLEPFGYRVTTVRPHGCLHLKSAVTALRNDLALVNSNWLDPRAIQDVQVVETHPEEPFAANALRVGPSVIYPSEFPRTRDRLELLGLDIRPVPAGELAKAEGAVTCCSIVFREGKEPADS